MGISEFFKPSAEAVQPRHVFAGWVQGTMLTAILAAVAYLNEAGPLAIVLVAVNVGLLSFLVLDKTTNKGAARVVVAALIAVGLVALGWTVWNKRQAADQYQLTMADMTVLRSGQTLPNGEGRVTGINPRLDLANENEFPVFYKIERQYGKIGTAAANLNNPGASVQRLDPGHGVYLGTDSLQGVLENGKYHEVQVEFVVLYGRSPDRLNKRFKYTADWQFFLCPVSGLLCGDVTATNDTLTNEWVDPTSEA